MEKALQYIAAVTLLLTAALNLIGIVYIWSKMKKLHLAQVLQLSGHFSAVLMVFFRSGVAVLGEERRIVWIGSGYSIANFCYYFFSNVYYAEFLKALANSTNTISYRASHLIQFVIAFVVFATSGGTVFRYTVYYHYSDNNWASRWASASGVTYIFTTALGFAGAMFVYHVFAKIYKRGSTFSNAYSEKVLQHCRQLLAVFVIVQVLFLGIYMSSGFLMLKPETMQFGLILGYFGTAIAAIEICLFTLLYEMAIKLLKHTTMNSKSQQLYTNAIESSLS
jgi:hypothetical protein